MGIICFANEHWGTCSTTAMPLTTRNIAKKGIPPRLHEPKTTAKTANKGISKPKQTRKRVASDSESDSDAEDPELHWDWTLVHHLQVSRLVIERRWMLLTWAIQGWCTLHQAAWNAQGLPQRIKFLMSSTYSSTLWDLQREMQKSKHTGQSLGDPTGDLEGHGREQSIGGVGVADK